MPALDIPAAGVALLALAACGVAAIEVSEVENMPRNHTVYGLVDKNTGQTEYVGRTTNPAARKSAHEKSSMRSHLDFVPIATGLNAIEARGFEQIQMLAHHTINTANKMNNQINGVSPLNNNLGMYMEAGRGVLGYLGNQISNDILYWTGQ